MRKYAVQSVQDSWLLKARIGEKFSVDDIVARIHILSLAVDLCDILAVNHLAKSLCSGTVSNPSGIEGEYLTNVRIPRIDAFICNAAYGGWSGVSWLDAIRVFFVDGMMEAITYPSYKIALPTRILNEQPQYGYVSSSVSRAKLP